MKVNSVVLARISKTCRVQWPGIIATSSKGEWIRPASKDYPRGAYFVTFINTRKESDFPTSGWVGADEVDYFNEFALLCCDPSVLSAQDRRFYLDTLKEAAALMENQGHHAVYTTPAIALLTRTLLGTRTRPDDDEPYKKITKKQKISISPSICHKKGSGVPNDDEQDASKNEMMPPLASKLVKGIRDPRFGSDGEGSN